MRTDAEDQEGDESDWVGAQAPAEVAGLWLRLVGRHGIDEELLEEAMPIEQRMKFIFRRACVSLGTQLRVQVLPKSEPLAMAASLNFCINRSPKL